MRASFNFKVVLFLAALLFAPVALAEQVILVFGDSLAAGYGIPAGRSWVNLLEERISGARLPYRVVNASISGETTLGGRNRIEKALVEHRPRIVIVELGANDGLRGHPLPTIRDNLTAIIEASLRNHARVLLVGMQLPPNYGTTYTEKFRELYADLARRHKVSLVPFLLEGFADDRDLFQPDGIHPNVEAQPRVLANVWPALQPLLKP
jgi:acyl-CoA thioesterase-1